MMNNADGIMKRYENWVTDMDLDRLRIGRRQILDRIPRNRDRKDTETGSGGVHDGHKPHTQAFGSITAKACETRRLTAIGGRRLKDMSYLDCVHFCISFSQTRMMVPSVQSLTCNHAVFILLNSCKSRR